MAKEPIAVWCHYCVYDNPPYSTPFLCLQCDYENVHVEKPRYRDSKREKLYLAGKMTGLPEFNYPAFFAAAARLREAGYDVHNPAESFSDTNLDWVHYMRKNIRDLTSCYGIAVLDNWKDSKGATLEVLIALALQMRIWNAVSGELLRVSIGQALYAFWTVWVYQPAVDARLSTPSVEQEA